ncbi:hypothetical protein R1sor_020696 [Riccia sorocarpa]|uniref:RNA-polymerase II-associated protein 3-like C-terminal domain-containing protein n=1 Tax=Riccia sorocarpa TaxID=122646 RepID=A0ABD3GI86_9MARC
MDVQRQIRENTLELHEFLNDLKGWESTVKEKEKNLKNQSAVNGSHVTPAPRKNHSKTLDNETKGSQAKAKDKEKTAPTTLTASKRKEKSEVPESKAGGTAASHTYDYFRDKWDRFDVDAALKEVESENEDEENEKVRKAQDKIVLPVRGSEPKRANTKSDETPAKIGAMEPGKLFGRGLGTMDRLPAYDEGMPTATSEKELGNDYFKEGKYLKAVDCYSRSIALQPTAIAYANRAMAALKLKKYQEAEDDCTEAISLDDRYTKAYSRRGTARRELKKLLPAVEDFEFALRLEPENKELKKQYEEARELYEKSTGTRLPDTKVPVRVREISSGNSASQEAPGAAKTTVPAAAKPTVPVAAKPTAVPVLPMSVTEPESKTTKAFGGGAKESSGASIRPLTQVDSPLVVAHARTAGNVPKVEKKKSVDSEAIQKAAARAAAAVTADRKVAAPKTAYEFESMWKGFDGNLDLQSRLIKVMDPASLPGVFKDSLTATVLVDIIRCLQLLFPDDASFAVQILENLTKVGRFSMTVMFLSAKDKSELGKLWDEIFMKASSELHPKLASLRATYRLT